MRILVVICLALSSHGVAAEELRIYQRDAYGNTLYHKPSYLVQNDGRIIELDPYGNKMYHKPQFRIEGRQIVPTDAIGNRTYNGSSGGIFSSSKGEAYGQ